MENKAQPEPIERRGPPIPKGMFKFANAILGLLLYSPLHGLISKNLMMITFTGKKTGKRISTPVGYLRKNGSIMVFTFSSWWKNLTSNNEVTLRLEGENVNGKAKIISDPRTAADMINLLLDKRGEEMGTRMGFKRIPSDSSPEELRKATQSPLWIQIDI